MAKKNIFAFVLIPFNDAFEDIYKLGIKEAAKQVDLVAERLDEQMFREGMLDRIYRQIDAADIIIADMSTKNPNVFYEVGYAHAKDKLCILLTSNGDDIPFDLKHRRHIVYDNSISYLKDELVKHLEWAKSEIENIRKSQIRIEMRSSASLETSANWAECSVWFTFDFFNDSSKPSAEIDAVYLYSGNDWSLKLSDKECPVIKSDVAPYSHRCFITPPVSRLQSNSWAQMSLSGKRIVATKWHGDEIRDNYRINGTVLLRLMTNNGIFDYEFNLNLVAEKLPF
jgi:hypothetical protein